MDQLASYGRKDRINSIMSVVTNTLVEGTCSVMSDAQAAELEMRSMRSKHPLNPLSELCEHGL